MAKDWKLECEVLKRKVEDQARRISYLDDVIERRNNEDQEFREIFRGLLIKLLDK